MSTLKVEWHGDELLARLKGATPQAAYEAGNVLLDESLKQVPHDTGALEQSGRVVMAEDGAFVTYGDMSTPYAVRWHENDANFQRGRKKKYLEDPANDSAVQQEMADRIKAVLGRQL